MILLAPKNSVLISLAILFVSISTNKERISIPKKIEISLHSHASIGIVVEHELFYLIINIVTAN